MIVANQTVPIRRNTRRLRNSGFTLLEVLVSLLVLSIGLIGLAGLQLTGVTNARDAYFRTQAVTLSYDMTDRMRANLNGVEDGDYDAGSGSVTASCRTTSGCSPAQMAADDIASWQATIAGLPGGEGIVCIDSSFNDGVGAASAACDGAGTQYVVKVWWNDDRNVATAKQRLATVFVP